MAGIPARSSRHADDSVRTYVRFAGWYSVLYKFIDAVYFDNIRLVNPDNLPGRGPVLYLGLHRNGAVDGFVYHRALNGPVFMISTQLRKNSLAKLFFDGIEVSRTKDKGNSSFNDAALHRCLDLLREGGSLFVFPEGTSSLGPRHLPFKSGAAWLLLNYLESAGPALQVVPVGIHYSCPQAFRGKVEVVVGCSISTALPAGASRLERLRILKRRIHAALKDVGINVSSEEYHDLIQSIAFIATMRTQRSYFKALKTMERAIPEPILREWRALCGDLPNTKLPPSQGLPPYPMDSKLLCALTLAVTGLLVSSAVVFNLPAFVAGWLAGKKLPDDRNVISLWKILIGIPCFALWIASVSATLIPLGKFSWLAIYAAVTWFGLNRYGSFKRNWVAIYNALRYPALRNRMAELRKAVLHSLPDENL